MGELGASVRHVAQVSWYSGRTNSASTDASSTTRFGSIGGASAGSSSARQRDRSASSENGGTAAAAPSSGTESNGDSVGEFSSLNSAAMTTHAQGQHKTGHARRDLPKGESARSRVRRARL